MPKYDVHQRLQVGESPIQGKNKVYGTRKAVPVGEAVTFEAGDPVAKAFLRKGAIALEGKNPKATKAELKKGEIEKLRELAAQKAKER